MLMALKRHCIDMAVFRMAAAAMILGIIAPEILAAPVRFIAGIFHEKAVEAPDMQSIAPVLPSVAGMCRHSPAFCLDLIKSAIGQTASRTAMDDATPTATVDKTRQTLHKTHQK